MESPKYQRLGQHHRTAPVELLLPNCLYRSELRPFFPSFCFFGTPFSRSLLGLRLAQRISDHRPFPSPERDGMPKVKLTWWDGGMMPPRSDDLEEGRQMGDSDGGVLFIDDESKLMCRGLDAAVTSIAGTFAMASVRLGWMRSR